MISSHSNKARLQSTVMICGHWDLVDTIKTNWFVQFNSGNILSSGELKWRTANQCLMFLIKMFWLALIVYLQFQSVSAFVHVFIRLISNSYIYPVFNYNHVLVFLSLCCSEYCYALYSNFLPVFMLVLFFLLFVLCYIIYITLHNYFIVGYVLIPTGSLKHPSIHPRYP